MKLALVQIVPWEKASYFKYDSLDLEDGNYVIVPVLNGSDLGRIVEIKKDVSPEEAEKLEIEGEVTRKAEKKDIDKALALRDEKNKTLKVCKKLVQQHGLPLKLIDAHFSVDDVRLTFSFIANGRIDFRDLLKDLIKKFKKNIRLQQIGVRDEAQLCGDFGSCGRELCCVKFNKEMESVTSDLAEVQQIAHRGAERLSGVCGRLRCCLGYEAKCYRDCLAKLPAIGLRVRTDHGRGKVINHHILKGSVDVLLDEGETIVEVPIKGME